MSQGERERSEREKGWPVAAAAASMFLELGKDLKSRHFCPPFFYNVEK